MVKPLFSFPCGFLFVFFRGNQGKIALFLLACKSHVSQSDALSKRRFAGIRRVCQRSFSCAPRPNAYISWAWSSRRRAPSSRKPAQHLNRTNNVLRTQTETKKAVDSDSRYQRTARDLQHSGIGLGCSGCTRKQSHARKKRRFAGL